MISKIRDAAGPLVEHVSAGEGRGVLAVVHLAAPVGPQRWAGYATVFEDHASLQIDGLSEEQVAAVLRALAFI